METLIRKLQEEDETVVEINKRVDTRKRECSLSRFGDLFVWSFCFEGNKRYTLYLRTT